MKKQVSEVALEVLCNKIFLFLKSLHIVDIGWPVLDKTVILIQETFFSGNFIGDKNRLIFPRIQVFCCMK